MTRLELLNKYLDEIEASIGTQDTYTIEEVKSDILAVRQMVTIAEEEIIGLRRALKEIDGTRGILYDDLPFHLVEAAGRAVEIPQQEVDR